MACKNQDCEKCGCDKPTQPEIPATLPMATPAPAPAVESDGFWKYVIGFLVGWLFFGC